MTLKKKKKKKKKKRGCLLIRSNTVCLKSGVSVTNLYLFANKQFVKNYANQLFYVMHMYTYQTNKGLFNFKY